MAMIAVLLDDHAREYRLPEPVIIASCFMYPGNIPKDWSTDYAGCHWFGRLSVPSDGSLCHVDTGHRLWRKDLKWTVMEVFGWPLVEIIDADRLHDRVITRLLAMLAKLPLMEQKTDPDPGAIEPVQPRIGGEGQP
jgi:hypothetical protein